MHLTNVHQLAAAARGWRGRDYFRCVSLRFILQGLFLMVATSFFFSSTSSISRAISPSDMDSSSSASESESDELETDGGGITTGNTKPSNDHKILQKIKLLLSFNIVM